MRPDKGHQTPVGRAKNLVQPHRLLRRDADILHRAAADNTAILWHGAAASQASRARSLDRTRRSCPFDATGRTRQVNLDDEILRQPIVLQVQFDRGSLATTTMDGVCEILQVSLASVIAGESLKNDEVRQKLQATSARCRPESAGDSRRERRPLPSPQVSRPRRLQIQRHADAKAYVPALWNGQLRSECYMRYSSYRQNL